MGYFSNGTEAELYKEKYCYKCVHWHINHGCPVQRAHWIWNYEECNKPDSILHKMIPRDKKGYNKECSFYIEQEQTNG